MLKKWLNVDSAIISLLYFRQLPQIVSFFTKYQNVKKVVKCGYRPYITKDIKATSPNR